jgi:hypothetical protein
MLDGVLALGLALGLLAVPPAVFAQSAEEVPRIACFRPEADCRDEKNRVQTVPGRSWLAGVA